MSKARWMRAQKAKLELLKSLEGPYKETVDYQHGQTVSAANTVQDYLPAARPFYVTGPICDYIAGAAVKMPQEPGITEAEIYRASGFVYLERPIPPRNDFRNRPVDRVLWCTTQARRADGNGFGLLLAVLEFATPGSNALGEDWQCTSSVISVGAADKVWEENRPGVAWLLAFFRFVEQKIVRTHRVEPDRSTRRQTERINVDIEDGSVLVVTLRREEQLDAKQPAGGSFEYQCQFEVSEHWRLQPYPSLGIVKPIWISSYVKGPPNKPLKLKTRVYEVTR